MSPASPPARPVPSSPLYRRRPALHLLPDHRAGRRDPGGIPAAARQPHLRLRRLPADLPLEPLFAAHRRRRFQPTRRAACTAADRSVQLDGGKFLRITEGSAIRRIGHLRWLRNIAVALGNAPYEDGIVLALRTRPAGRHAGRTYPLGAGATACPPRGAGRRGADGAEKRLIRAVEKVCRGTPDGVRRAAISPDVSLCGFVHKNKTRCLSTATKRASDRYNVLG